MHFSTSKGHICIVFLTQFTTMGPGKKGYKNFGVFKGYINFAVLVLLILESLRGQYYLMLKMSAGNNKKKKSGFL